MIINQSIEYIYIYTPVKLGEKVGGETTLITGMLALHHMLVHLTQANCILPNPFWCI